MVSKMLIAYVGNVSLLSIIIVFEILPLYLGVIFADSSLKLLSIIRPVAYRYIQEAPLPQRAQRVCRA